MGRDGEMISVKVDNLSYGIDKWVLRDMFEKYGEIGDVRIFILYLNFKIATSNKAFAQTCFVHLCQQLFKSNSTIVVLFHCQVYIPNDPRSGDPRQFGFVRFYDERDAEDAVKEMDG